MDLTDQSVLTNLSFLSNWSVLTADWSVLTLSILTDELTDNHLMYWLVISRYPFYQLWRVVCGCIWIIVSALVPFWDYFWDLSFSLRCLTIQYVRPGTRAWQFHNKYLKTTWISYQNGPAALDIVVKLMLNPIANNEEN